MKDNDLYKLTMLDYNNQTVEVNVVYEIRIYSAETEEKSSDDLPILM